jgi:hypothetical protein
MRKEQSRIRSHVKARSRALRKHGETNISSTLLKHYHLKEANKSRNGYDIISSYKGPITSLNTLKQCLQRYRIAVPLEMSDQLNDDLQFVRPDHALAVTEMMLDKLFDKQPLPKCPARFTRTVSFDNYLSGNIPKLLESLIGKQGYVVQDEFDGYPADHGSWLYKPLYQRRKDPKVLLQLYGMALMCESSMIFPWWRCDHEDTIDAHMEQICSDNETGEPDSQWRRRRNYYTLHSISGEVKPNALVKDLKIWKEKGNATDLWFRRLVKDEKLLKLAEKEMLSSSDLGAWLKGIFWLIERDFHVNHYVNWQSDYANPIDCYSIMYDDDNVLTVLDEIGNGGGDFQVSQLIMWQIYTSKGIFGPDMTKPHYQMIEVFHNLFALRQDIQSFKRTENSNENKTGEIRSCFDACCLSKQPGEILHRTNAGSR